jgi:uncharacterized protein (DUF2147 family)
MLFPPFRLIIASIFALALLPAPRLARAQLVSTTSASQASPAGRWKTIDDTTGKAKSIVRIHEENGRLYGTIETLFDPPVPHPTCYLCSGARKDQPLVGLQVLWGFHSDSGQWSGGQILDPETGKIYRAWLALEDDGRRLRLHGYNGIPIFGRTAYWVRAE